MTALINNLSRNPKSHMDAIGGRNNVPTEVIIFVLREANDKNLGFIPEIPI